MLEITEPDAQWRNSLASTESKLNLVVFLTSIIALIISDEIVADVISELVNQEERKETYLSCLY